MTFHIFFKIVKKFFPVRMAGRDHGFFGGERTR
jgi:hypothetical protein